MNEASRWDAAEFFESEEEALLYLREAARGGTTEEVRAALGDVVRYYGVHELAKRAGLDAADIFAELNGLGSQRGGLVPGLLDRLGPALNSSHSRPDAAE